MLVSDSVHVLHHAQFLLGAFIEPLAGITTHGAVRVTAVQYVLLVIAMRLFNVFPFAVLMHIIAFGYVYLSSNGNLILIQPPTVFGFVFGITHTVFNLPCSID